MPALTDQFMHDRIAVIQARILVYEAALTALTDPTIHIYDLDSGQGRQRVTRTDIPAMERVIASLENRLVTLDARVTGSGTTQVRPAA